MLDTAPPGYVETAWPQIGRLFALEESTVALEGHLVGYFMALDGGACLRAAVATALQTPIERIPADLDDAGKLLMWCDGQGIGIDFRRPGVGPRPVGLGIAVTRPLADRDDYGRPPSRHTIVLLDGVIFFDPAGRFLWPSGQPPAPVQPDEIDHVVVLTPSRKDPKHVDSAL